MRIDASFVVHLGDIVHPPVEDTHVAAIDLAAGSMSDFVTPSTSFRGTTVAAITRDTESSTDPSIVELLSIG